jgi:hypothetical protein
MTEPFQIEVTIAAPVDEVWQALRDPARIRHWHGWELEENGGLDAEIDVIYTQDVVESEDSHTLTLKGADVFTLHDAGAGRTLLRLVRAPRGTNPDWDAYYDDISEGWIIFLQQLRFALERHPDSPRRTVFLSGAAGSPLAALGLPTDIEPGARYTATLAGEQVAGQVWFRSTNQAGFTVDGWGDGLIITGKGLAVLTTYGQNDQAYQQFQAHWTEWWAALPAPSEV